MNDFMIAIIKGYIGLNKYNNQAIIVSHDNNHSLIQFASEKCFWNCSSFHNLFNVSCNIAVRFQLWNESDIHKNIDQNIRKKYDNSQKINKHNQKIKNNCQNIYVFLRARYLSDIIQVGISDITDEIFFIANNEVVSKYEWVTS